ncbi:hypothetical protein MKW98_020642 [Papaver atlanticum]|uniref:Uncharacterized protein n=1 Tax=Papaver atlanticum TaxID=357466 RepID=A0AAD4TI76_9MAGN|nr:hypothetical protein MKW98_020642 [Papaver atlanticum]
MFITSFFNYKGVGCNGVFQNNFRFCLQLQGDFGGSFRVSPGRDYIEHINSTTNSIILLILAQCNRLCCSQAKLGNQKPLFHNQHMEVQELLRYSSLD